MNLIKIVSILCILVTVSGCDPRAFQDEYGDIREERPADPITVDGNTYLVTEVTVTFTSDGLHSTSTDSRPTQGERTTNVTRQVNVNGRTVICSTDELCVRLVREELARQRAVRIPVNDGEEM